MSLLEILQQLLILNMNISKTLSCNSGIALLILKVFLYAERQRVIVLKPRHRVKVRMGIRIEVEHFKELRLIVKRNVLVRIVWHDLLVHHNTRLCHRILTVVQMVLLLLPLLFQVVILINNLFL